jgi:hypothetical protein
MTTNAIVVACWFALNALVAAALYFKPLPARKINPWGYRR